ncbi:MAG: hypothetical protein SAK29_28155 [Scytonema sp. PMC 1069.18]|nr:hypothetical protein [Scytonema sp. PMC 1069.18]MEC4879865.1 hypothetical protein [Scytonema sp. PMC 1070.18]
MKLLVTEEGYSRTLREDSANALKSFPPDVFDWSWQKLETLARLLTQIKRLLRKSAPCFESLSFCQKNKKP